jgi:hypothetical protein
MCDVLVKCRLIYQREEEKLVQEQSFNDSVCSFFSGFLLTFLFHENGFSCSKFVFHVLPKSREFTNAH